MSPKGAVVDFNKCKPSECTQGVCPAVKVCPRNILKQDEPGEPPYRLVQCPACGDCVAACPLKAITISQN